MERLAGRPYSAIHVRSLGLGELLFKFSFCEYNTNLRDLVKLYQIYMAH